MPICADCDRPITCSSNRECRRDTHRAVAKNSNFVEPYGVETGRISSTTPGVSNTPKSGNPLDVQVGGSHYKGKAIQPVEYIQANDLNFLEGCIVKRITRWREKQTGDDRFVDLKKIKHEVDLLIELEEKYPRV